MVSTGLIKFSNLEKIKQLVGIELFTHIESKDLPIKLKFWRDHNGPEIDFVLEQEGKYTPIEVKLTTAPQKKIYAT